MIGTQAHIKTHRHMEIDITETEIDRLGSRLHGLSWTMHKLEYSRHTDGQFVFANEYYSSRWVANRWIAFK